MLTTPLFDSALLVDIYDAAERRGKAIRYQGTMECSREVARGIERLNIDVAMIHSVRLRFSVWPDGAFWLGITQPGPRRTGGWRMNEQFEGTVARLTPSDVIARLESLPRVVRERGVRG
jgi:hypothetical protein